MMRRVSPEGRARALKEQQRRQKATNRLILRCLLAGVIIALLLWGASLAIPLSTAEIVAAIAKAVLRIFTST